MTLALIILCLILCIREVSFMHERKQWRIERKELYSRIQAGSLLEYEQVTRKPTATVAKTRDQLIAEEANDKGVSPDDLKYPAHWK